MKYPCIPQACEEDCGVACIASVAKSYQRHLPLNRIREVTGTGKRGTNLLGLKQGAEALGFETRSVKANRERLDKLHSILLPGIIHWEGDHWVVLYAKQGDKYVVADPAVGIRYLDHKTLWKGWLNGIMLSLKPDPLRWSSLPDEEVGGFGRFLRRVLPYRYILAEALLINTILGVLALGSPFILQILTDDILIRGEQQLLTRISIAVCIMHIVSSSLALVQSHLIAHFTQRLELGLVLDFARQVLHLPLKYYENRNSGEIVSRLDDIYEVNGLVSQIVVSLPSQFFIGLISVGLMSFYSWKLTTLAVAIAVIMTISTLVLLPILQQKTRSLMILDAENQGVLVETFKGALTLKTTAAFAQFWSEFQSRFSRLANLTLSTRQIAIFNDVFSDLVAALGSIILLWFGSSLVIQQELSIGQLMAFNALNGNLTVLISTLVEFVDEFTRVKFATERLIEVINEKPETQDDSKKPWVEIPLNADIICTNLNFKHLGRVSLLQDFTLTFPHRKVIALIGKSGCGKSTLAKLMANLYQPQSGNISFGGYNQQDISLDCLRKQVVLVPQDAHFWSRSILDNFRLGNPHLSFERIVKSCQITGADEFIAKLPDKFQTVLGEFGSNLSGGQRQRLALARAIVNEPPILILDESTGALDPVSEIQVLDSLLKHRQAQTTIMISHRPTVIQRADWIVMMEEGRLKLQGTPEDLHYQPGEHQKFLMV